MWIGLGLDGDRCIGVIPRHIGPHSEDCIRRGLEDHKEGDRRGIGCHKRGMEGTKEGVWGICAYRSREGKRSS